MFQFLRSKKGQAATEIAIVGAIIILVFSYLITFTVRLNQKQLYLQRSFRAALDRAKTTGSSYADVGAYKQMPNIVDPYAPGAREGFFGSAIVLRSPTGYGNDSEIYDIKGSEDSSGTYTKTIERKETPGALPETTVTIDGGAPVFKTY